MLLQKKAPCQLAGSDSEAENDDDDEDHDEVPAARSITAVGLNESRASACRRTQPASVAARLVCLLAWVRVCEMKNRRIRLRC